MRLATIGLKVTTDSGRFAGRTGTILEHGGMPGEVWVQWLEPSISGTSTFKTLDIASIANIRPV